MRFVTPSKYDNEVAVKLELVNEAYDTKASLLQYKTAVSFHETIMWHWMTSSLVQLVWIWQIRIAHSATGDTHGW